ncbi:hypothetical protein [Nostoc sp. MG11]|uniref:hypothetical protein n=1 Tax=Nostoc sp. MG11 TaxID=2721166 RepID=UPI0018684634|nr:hypothetical protein [Nostoc sp. MG11]
MKRQISERYEPLLIEIKKLNDSGKLIDELINNCNDEELYRCLKKKGDCFFLTLAYGGLLNSFQELFRKYGFELCYYLVESSSAGDFYNVGFFVPFKIRELARGSDENALSASRFQQV